MTKPLSSHRILALIQGTELLGQERGNLEALAALQRQGATIMIGISSRAPGGGAVGEDARRRGFETHEFPMGSHFSKHWMLKDRRYRNRQVKRLITNSKLLTSLIRTWKPTHLHIAAHTTFIFFALALLTNRTPLLFRCGDAPPTNSFFQVFLWKWMARRSNRIVAVSHYIKDQISNTLPSATSKTTVIHNIAPFRRGVPDTKKIAQLKELKKPFQLIYLGQIHPIKGVPELVEALLALDNDEIGCWMVGGSVHTMKEAERLRLKVMKSRSNTSIEWLGFQNDPRPYLASADWHIAPSICNEAFGNVVREAQSMGIPSIVSPNGGLPETIEEGKSGLILEAITPQAIQTCIKQARNLNQKEYQKAALHYGSFKNKLESFELAWQRALN